MAKRFTDTDKWISNKWFRKLEPRFKLFWIYICDMCDAVGVWDEDLELAEICIGEQYDQDELLQIFDGRLRVLSNHKWWITGFCDFQYPKGLDENSNSGPILSAVSLLKKHSLWVDYHKSSTSPKEKDKDKEEEKDKEKESRHNHGINNHVLLTDTNYSELCDRYGKQLADEYIQKVDDYCENHGKSYTNWTNAVHTFIRNDVKRGKLKLETPKEKKICPECGGDMLGGVCMKCGWSKSRPGKIE